jgi:hypothetical protein
MFGFIYATTAALDNANKMIAAEHNVSPRRNDDNRSG